MKPVANFDSLIRVFEDRRFEPQGDLHRAIEGLPPAEAMPSPWAAWTFIYLICCRRKQLRAAEVVASLLGPEWEWRCGRADVDEAACEAFYHSQSEWEFRSLGGDLFLAHAETGDLTHVDLVYGPEVIKELWFGSQLGGVEFDAVERRLDELFPHGHGLTLALEELRLAELIDAVDEDNFELSERLKNCAEPVASFVAAWEDPDNRVWLGALINDWPAAYEAAKLAGDPTPPELVRERVQRCQELRCVLLRDEVAAAGLSADLLYGFDAAGAPDLPAYLEEALSEPTELTTAALELISDDPSWCPQVHRLFRDLSPWSEGFSQQFAERGAEYLVKHGYHARQVIQALASVLLMPGQAALLALRHRSELATPLIRSALRGVQESREMVAAALAVIDQHWSRRELTGVLDESGRPEETLECRLALRESQSFEARLAAESWEEGNLRPAADTTTGRSGCVNKPAPGPYSDEDEKNLRCWMGRLRPLLSDVESPTPFTDMLGG